MREYEVSWVPHSEPMTPGKTWKAPVELAFWGRLTRDLVDRLVGDPG